jgi:hypothetical protein
VNPLVAALFLRLLLRRLWRVKALHYRQFSADAGKCPTCRDPIAGLAPLPPGEHRDRPWAYCETCKADDRDRKAAVRLRKGMTPRRKAA